MFLKWASIVAVVVAAGEASAASYNVVVLQDVGGGNNSVKTGRVSPGGGVGTENSFSLIQ